MDIRLQTIWTLFVYMANYNFWTTNYTQDLNKLTPSCVLMLKDLHRKLAQYSRIRIVVNQEKILRKLVQWQNFCELWPFLHKKKRSMQPSWAHSPQPQIIWWLNWEMCTTKRARFNMRLLAGPTMLCSISTDGPTQHICAKIYLQNKFLNQ